MRKISIHGGTLDVEYLDSTGELAILIVTPDGENPAVKVRCILGRLETRDLLNGIADVLVKIRAREIEEHEAKRVVDPGAL